MRAITYSEFGSPEVLQLKDIDVPRPKDDEVLVKMKATSVNPIDWKFRQGMLKPVTKYRLPVIPGGDICGTVEEIGFDVQHLQVGDEIFGLTPAVGGGTYAEYATVKSQYVWYRPSNLTYSEAAAIPLAGLTAYQGLYWKGKVHSRMRIMINGCTGGVGSFAVQIAKSYDCEVTGVCHSKNVDFAEKLGVDHIIAYDKQDPLKTNNRFDIFYDVHGSYKYDHVKDKIYKDGKFVNTQPSFKGFFNSLTHKQAERIWVDPNRRDLENLKIMAEKRMIRPQIDSIYPLEKAAEAQEHAQHESVRGKVILEIN